MLILVRHGQTVANAQGRLLGRLESRLTPLGQQQATLTAAAVLVSVDRIEQVITSPLARARETAARFGQPVTVDERWIELDYGVLDGRSVAEVPPETWARWRKDIHYTPEGGESLAALGRRVREACASLVEIAARGNVVVVSHVSPIKAAIAWALDAGDDIAWRMRLDVSSVCRIAVGADGPGLRSFNEVAHLTPC